MPAIPTITRSDSPSPRGQVIELLRQADTLIDDIFRYESGYDTAPLPRTDMVEHHVVALAGILRRTHADSLTMQVGSIIVTARRIGN